MRLFLLPISTRRALIYAERQPPNPSAKPSLADRITNKANQTWASWERETSGWKASLTRYGNKVLDRIHYEEWGLKSIPPLSESRRRGLLEGAAKGGEGEGEGEGGRKLVEVVFPGRFLREERVKGVLGTLATERQSLHRKRLIWSVVGMPLSAPFALVPIVPNLPFFYLVFRAWSHYRALNGGRHLEFLVQNNLIKPSPSTALDELYTAGLIHPTRQVSRDAPIPTEQQAEEVAELVRKQTNDGTEDVMLLKRWNGKLLAERFKLPEMEIEIERAVTQVENSIKAKEELLEEKKEIEKATSGIAKGPDIKTTTSTPTDDRKGDGR